MSIIVSIPFKRESTCAQEGLNLENDVWGYRFQFPSNGKAHVHIPDDVVKHPNKRVSIPFKRESTCARGRNQAGDVEGRRFQFPSNGKAHVHSRC